MVFITAPESEESELSGDRTPDSIGCEERSGRVKNGRQQAARRGRCWNDYRNWLEKNCLEGLFNSFVAMGKPACGDDDGTPSVACRRPVCCVCGSCGIVCVGNLLDAVGESMCRARYFSQVQQRHCCVEYSEQPSWEQPHQHQHESLSLQRIKSSSFRRRMPSLKEIS